MTLLSKKAAAILFALKLSFSKIRWSILLNLSITTRMVTNPLDARRSFKKSIAILVLSMAPIGMASKRSLIFILLT